MPLLTVFLETPVRSLLVLPIQHQNIKTNQGHQDQLVIQTAQKVLMLTFNASSFEIALKLIYKFN